jgi:hypothetical protein
MKPQLSKNKTKQRESDEDSDELTEQEDKKGKKMTQYEKDVADLESAEVIPDSEVSPAAFIFQQTEEEQQQILFEEK